MSRIFSQLLFSCAVELRADVKAQKPWLTWIKRLWPNTMKRIHPGDRTTSQSDITANAAADAGSTYRKLKAPTHAYRTQHVTTQRKRAPHRLCQESQIKAHQNLSCQPTSLERQLWLDKNQCGFMHKGHHHQDDEDSCRPVHNQYTHIVCELAPRQGVACTDEDRVRAALL